MGDGPLSPALYIKKWGPALASRAQTSHLRSENKTSGYFFIHAEGGLNQQRIAICNAVAIAKTMEATLILPVLKQDQIWNDQTYTFLLESRLTPALRLRSIIIVSPYLMFTMRTVKNIPKYSSAQFYIDNVLPRIKEKTIMSTKPFVERLGVNYHTLKFLPDIEEMADKLATKMRNRTSSGNPYMALHLRYEKGMVGLSFCDFAGTRDEKVMMAAYRQKEWPRRFKNGSHLWPLALQKRKERVAPLSLGNPDIRCIRASVRRQKQDGSAQEHAPQLGDQVGAAEHGGDGALPEARDEPGGAGLPGVPACATGSSPSSPTRGSCPGPSATRTWPGPPSLRTSSSGTRPAPASLSLPSPTTTSGRTPSPPACAEHETDRVAADHAEGQRRLLVAHEDERVMAEWRQCHPEDVTYEQAYWARRREEETQRRRAEWLDRRRRKALALSQCEIVENGGETIFASYDDRWEDMWLDTSDQTNEDGDDDDDDDWE
uniref:O-fucosyltransferase family protein n=1 Tax=Aegilops tauschii TaxID=37682 RepID=N1QYA7_AEGTA